jgi:hypothetical protein
MIIPGDAGQVFSHVDSKRLINALTEGPTREARSLAIAVTTTGDARVLAREIARQSAFELMLS